MEIDIWSQQTFFKDQVCPGLFCLCCAHSTQLLGHGQSRRYYMTKELGWVATKPYLWTLKFKFCIVFHVSQNVIVLLIYWEKKKKKTLLAQELCRKNKPALTCRLKFTNTGVQSQGKRVGLKAFMVFLTLHISNFRVWKCFTQHSNGELCRLSDIAENNPGVMMTWQEYSIILHQCGLHDF